MPKTSKTRIYTDGNLSCDSQLVLSPDLAHYLLSVMRLSSGEHILAFDGRSGEYECELQVFGKKSAAVKILSKTRDFVAPPDVRLLFAPLKKDCTDFVIEKAVELGARAIIPIITEHSISDKIKIERWRAQAIEAAEQSRRVDIPSITEPVALSKFVAGYKPERTLYFMDETGNGKPVAQVFQNAPAPADFLIGPEGGFSDSELNLLRSQPFARAVSLGPRILRAETAALAALSCWQSLSGDWQ